MMPLRQGESCDLADGAPSHPPPPAPVPLNLSHLLLLVLVGVELLLLVSSCAEPAYVASASESLAIGTRHPKTLNP